MQTNLKPTNPPVHVTTLTLASLFYKSELSINSIVQETFVEFLEQYLINTGTEKYVIENPRIPNLCENNKMGAKGNRGRQRESKEQN